MKYLVLWAFAGVGVIVTGCAAHAESDGSGGDGMAAEPMASALDHDTARDALLEEPRDSTPCIPGRVWNAGSARIELSSFSFWTGSSRYEKARDELTRAQSVALEGLCLTDTPRQMAADITSYKITITDQSGRRRQYRAAYRDMLDIDEGQPGGKQTIAYASLKPFLDTIHCLSAGDTRSIGPEVPPPVPPWKDAPSLSGDPGCYHGIFVPAGCKDIWLKLPIDTKGKREIRAVDCIGTLTLRILSEDGVELARSRAAAAPNCPKVSYAFEEKGTYLVKIEKKNGSVCTDQGPAGDFFIRIKEAR